jgi:hypothetical protein
MWNAREKMKGILAKIRPASSRDALAAPCV